MRVDGAGVQATEKRRDVIRAAGKQQHRAIPQISLGLQRAGNGSRTLVQFAIAEHHSLIPGFGEKTQGHTIRRQGCAALKGLDQCAGEFERVGHEVSCLNSACKWNRFSDVTPLRGRAGRGLCRPRKALGIRLCRGYCPEPFTNENGWHLEIISRQA